MRVRDFLLNALALLGVLFSVLTLCAGLKNGTLNFIPIITYSYEFNYDSNSTAEHPPYNSTLLPAGLNKALQNDLHWFFFTVNYLSICAGYAGGTEDEEDYIVDCQRKTPGFTFRTDDPYIVNFWNYNGTYPVESDVPLSTFSTTPPFASLMIGMVLSILSAGTLGIEALGKWPKWPNLSQANTLLLWIAAVFLTISAALLTRIADKQQNDYISWSQRLEAFIWSAAAFMLLASLCKLGDFILQREKKRHLLRTGQI